jgi:hypothetical protein
MARLPRQLSGVKQPRLWLGRVAASDPTRKWSVHRSSRDNVDLCRGRGAILVAGAGSTPDLASVLQEGRKSANTILGIPVTAMRPGTRNPGSQACPTNINQNGPCFEAQDIAVFRGGHAFAYVGLRCRA